MRVHKEAIAVQIVMLEVVRPDHPLGPSPKRVDTSRCSTLQRYFILELEHRLLLVCMG